MFVIIQNLHIKTGVINLVIDLSLHSQLFRVYCDCIDLDHNFTYSGFSGLKLFQAAKIFTIIVIESQKPWPLLDITPFSCSDVYHKYFLYYRA